MFGSLNLTFGIELEFVVVYPRSHLYRLYPQLLHDTQEEHPAGWAIHHFLRGRGIPVTGYEDLDEDVRAFAPYTAWRVDTEDHELDVQESRAMPGEDYSQESVELASPRFWVADPYWPRKIMTVLQALKDLEKFLKCRTICNTGLHVHVGNGDEKVPLKTCKNVLHVVTAFERCFDILHTGPRIMHNTQHVNCPSFFFRHSPITNRDDRLLAWLGAIEKCSTYEDIGELHVVRRPNTGHPNETTGHNAAYNFDNLFADPEIGRYEEHLTNTIEFRQHVGTLDPGEIFAWIGLVTHLLFHVGIFNDRFDTLDLFRVLCVPPLVFEHYARQLDRNRDWAMEKRERRLGAEDGTEFFVLMAQFEDTRYRNGNLEALSMKRMCKFASLEYGVWSINLLAEFLCYFRSGLSPSVGSEGGLRVAVGEMNDTYSLEQ
ncbi:hypothetical protein LTR66_001915 [Elasticomyces elasticus]|nr:hypothetical protein LTR66_001915 [Elasticomyces elasticus]